MTTILKIILIHNRVYIKCYNKRYKLGVRKGGDNWIKETGIPDKKWHKAMKMQDIVKVSGSVVWCCLIVNILEPSITMAVSKLQWFNDIHTFAPSKHLVKYSKIPLFAFHLINSTLIFIF